MRFEDKILTLVAAIGANRALGLDGAIPWHLPAELKHFKHITMGKAIVMGRKTWESIGRPLPGRHNIVLTHDRAYTAAGCSVVHSLDDAVQSAWGAEVMVIGGGELYRQALPKAQRMILTLVDCRPQADTWFPQWEPAHWMVESRRCVAADAHNPYGYEVVEMQRIQH